MNTKHGLAISALILLAAGCAKQSAIQPTAFAPLADIEVTSSPNTPILIYSSAPAQFALRGQTFQLRADTIRTTTPAQLQAYLDRGDIHVASVGTASLMVEATIAHAPATHATATGRHVVLDARGSGIRTAD